LVPAIGGSFDQETIALPTIHLGGLPRSLQVAPDFGSRYFGGNGAFSAAGRAAPLGESQILGRQPVFGNHRWTSVITAATS
jgi:hypothetical protein